MFKNQIPLSDFCVLMLAFYCISK